jgi:cytochrome c biogenesis protein CcmG, thiol:disulfide interchange protein DsbE
VRQAWVVVAASVAGLMVAGCGRHGTDRDADGVFRPLDVGAAVPAYMAHALSGDSVRLGGPEPPTVLNVWATWCTSCREEMAALDTLQRTFAGRGVRVIAVSVDEGDGTRVRRFAMGTHARLTFAHDPLGAIEQSYRVMGVPTTMVIDRAGRLVWSHTGSITDVLAEASAAITTASASLQ